MPNKLDSIKYSEEQDGRVKILKSQYDEVRAKYVSLQSMRATAAYYGVDKRLIQFIIYPERLEALKAHNKLIKHHRKYYDKDKWRETMRKFRARKKEILNPKDKNIKELK
jgi:hypothetical protein